MPLRSFSDRDGFDWRVWSVVPDPSAAVTLEPSLQAGWLCFERLDGANRRRLPLSDAPPAWDALPDERLDLLRRVAVTSGPTALEPTEAVRAMPVPLEDEARTRPSGPKSAIGGEDELFSP